VPVVLGAPRSVPADRLRALADTVLGPLVAEPVAEPGQPAKKEKRGLFGRR
jgi:hypothetical protein